MFSFATCRGESLTLFKKIGGDMNSETSVPRKTVVVYEFDRCPECIHAWSDYGECHFHDCRYFWLDKELDVECSAFEDSSVVRRVTIDGPITWMED